MDLLLADTTGSVALSVFDQAGDPVDMDALPVVTVKDGAGGTLSTGTATSTGTGTYAFPVAPALLDTLTVLWEGEISTNPASFTTYAEAVGAVPLVPADIRAVDEDLADDTKYPDARVQSAIEQAWEILERNMRIGIVPRGRRVTLDGSGTTDLLLPDLHPIAVYTVDGAAASDVDCYDSGIAYRSGGWTAGRRNVSLHYAHGFTSTPEPVLGALITLTVDKLITRATPGRATSLSTDVGAFRLTIAGRDGPTGIPDVDAVIDQFGYAAAVGFA